jgi:hypothetical protein
MFCTLNAWGLRSSVIEQCRLRFAIKNLLNRNLPRDYVLVSISKWPAIGPDQFESDCVFAWHPSPQAKRISIVKPHRIIVVDDVTYAKVATAGSQLCIAKVELDDNSVVNSECLSIFEIQNNQRFCCVSTARFRNAFQG